MDKITVDLPAELFTEIAAQAHADGVTINELLINLLAEYGAGRITLDEEAIHNAGLEDSVRKAVNAVLAKLTPTTLKEYGFAYANWCENYSGECTIDELIMSNEPKRDFLDLLSDPPESHSHLTNTNQGQYKLRKIKK